MDLHLGIPERSQPYHGIMKQVREQFSVDTSQGRRGKLDDSPDFFDGGLGLMHRLGGDIVLGKLAKCRLKLEASDYLEFPSDRFAKSEMKAWLSFQRSLAWSFKSRGRFFYGMHSFRELSR